MTLREGRRGLLKPSEYRHWPNRRITFIGAKKKLNLMFILLYLRYMWGKGLVEKSYGEEGLAENVRIPSYSYGKGV